MMHKPETRNQKPEAKRVRSFTDLQVFRRAYTASLDVHRVSLTFPKTEQYALADQMRRASKSICANMLRSWSVSWGSNARL